MRLALEELRRILRDEDFFVAGNDVHVGTRVWKRNPPLGALESGITGHI